MYFLILRCMIERTQIRPQNPRLLRQNLSADFIQVCSSFNNVIKIHSDIVTAAVECWEVTACIARHFCSCKKRGPSVR